MFSFKHIQLHGCCFLLLSRFWMHPPYCGYLRVSISGKTLDSRGPGERGSSFLFGSLHWSCSWLSVSAKRASLSDYRMIKGQCIFYFSILFLAVINVYQLLAIDSTKVSRIKMLSARSTLHYWFVATFATKSHDPTRRPCFVWPNCYWIEMPGSFVPWKLPLKQSGTLGDSGMNLAMEKNEIGPLVSWLYVPSCLA